MVTAWFMDNNPDDPCLEHHQNPPNFLSEQELLKTTGVECFYIDPDNREKLNIIRKERNYSYEDEVTVSKESLPNFADKLRMFYEEHLHSDEEIRYVLEGSGYFDVRDVADRWIRILIARGDLIIVPSGIYHRFTLDMNKYVRVKRYFIGEPEWIAHNRPAEEMECRKVYLEKFRNNSFVQSDS